MNPRWDFQLHADYDIAKQIPSTKSNYRHGKLNKKMSWAKEFRVDSDHQ